MSTYEWDRSYKDLCSEIDILTIRRDELSAELNILKRRIMTAGPRTKLVASYSGMPGGGGEERTIEQTWGVYGAVEEAIQEVEDILSLKREAKKRMEAIMSKFDTLEYRVAYLRDIERKSLTAISIELGYSYDWICKLSGKTKRVRKVS